jgi:hypothetical protein
MKCQDCGNEIKDIKRKKFCSRECGVRYHVREYSRKKYREYKENADQRAKSKKCKYCGEMFWTRNSNKIYCSGHCRDKNKYKKHVSKSYIKKYPCEFCGFDDLRAIHRHHVDRKNNPDEIMMLCANCHTIFHNIVGFSKAAHDYCREDVLEVLRK